jgi:hypothetical protein
VITAVAALATVRALVTACFTNGGPSAVGTVGRDALQTDIAARLAKAGQQPQSVRCNEDLVGAVGKPGNTVDCTVVLGEDTGSFTLTVTTVSGGNINYSFAPRP